MVDDNLGYDTFRRAKYYFIFHFLCLGSLALYSYQPTLVPDFILNDSTVLSCFIQAAFAQRSLSSPSGQSKPQVRVQLPHI